MSATGHTGAESSFHWILYDGRADLGDTDDAAVLEAFASRRDLKKNLWNWNGHDGVLYEYDVLAGGNELINERRIGHIRDGKQALLALCSRQSHRTDEHRNVSQGEKT